LVLIAANFIVLGAFFTGLETAMMTFLSV